MSDDQVGCEWVSVSSGTGLPGLSRTKAVKRFCVCVCVYLIVNVYIPKKLFSARYLLYLLLVTMLCLHIREHLHYFAHTVDFVCTQSE